jgi:non-heme chloroperoxidase
MKSTLAILLLCVLSAPHVIAETTKSGFIQTSNGIHIHYVEAGEGRAIVFIPGWRMPGWIWQKQIDELSKKYRVIAVDPTCGHLPQTCARAYKALLGQLGFNKPVLFGWSMGCGELLSYVEQFGEDGISGVVLVDGLIPAQQNPKIVSLLSQWTNQLQQDRQQEADVLVRAMYKKPQPEDYIPRVKHATFSVPTDTAVALLYSMISVADFSKSFARINRPVLFAYDRALQPNADFLKAKLGDKVRLERFDGDGHALFVDDPVKFNRAVEQFVQSLPKQ